MRGETGAGIVGSTALKIVTISLGCAALWAGAFGQEGADYPHQRRDLRISAYAPPTIPHDADNPDCLGCHATNEVGAPMIPHREIANCLQCHVPQAGGGLFRKNTFGGVAEPVKLARAYKGAPPVSPHRFFMRENCLACHGRDARPDVVHTSHPDRINCLQCHIEQSGGVALFRRNTNIPDPLGRGQK
jgi:nitrate reductase cytochrome c-type subunit